MSLSSQQQRALLIIDMQVGLFHGPDQPYERERILETIRTLIGKARTAGIPIFAAQHTGPEGSPIAAGSPLWQLLPELGLNSDFAVAFNKTRPSCFYQTSLTENLNDRGIKELVIVGMKTQYCIDATCRSAVELGFKPILIADAHTCMDTALLPAKTIIEHHNQTLSGAFVQLISSHDLEF